MGKKDDIKRKQLEEMALLVIRDMTVMPTDQLDFQAGFVAGWISCEESRLTKENT